MAQADVKNVSQLDVEPGQLPKTMTAWVIRQEREGEPKDAFQIEDIEVPEPGPFEVIVRVMAAGVNFNNVWAARGVPVSVFRYHPEEAASYGLTYFTAYRMLIDRCNIQAGHKVLIWGAAGGLGVFATQLCKLAGADSCGVVSSEDKGELVMQLGANGFINRKEFEGMMRKGGESPDEEKARFKEMRRFGGAVREVLGDDPDIVFEHVGQATFPTSVFVVKRFGKVVICGATSGYNLDFDVRYLWMRQKEIIGSHFANAYQANEANKLMAASKIRPVLWKTMPFEGVAEAHQMMRENKHLGKIAILVGAEEEGLGKTEEGPGAIRAEVGS